MRQRRAAGDVRDRAPRRANVPAVQRRRRSTPAAVAGVMKGPTRAKSASAVLGLDLPDPRRVPADQRGTSGTRVVPSPMLPMDGYVAVGTAVGTGRRREPRR